MCEVFTSRATTNVGRSGGMQDRAAGKQGGNEECQNDLDN